MTVEPVDIIKERDELKAAVVEYQARIKELEHLVDHLQKKPYRPSSESYDGMASLFDEAESATKAEESAPRKSKVGQHERRVPARRPLPEDLPREVIRHELPEGEQVCQCCGGALHEIGVEASEQLDIIPQKIQVLRHERVKYGCRECESGVVTTKMPPQPIPKSMASPSTLAYVAVAKYADHLPLYRQEAMWGRYGIQMDRGTLAAWMVKCGVMVQSLVNLLAEDALRDGVVHCDETTVQVLREKGKKATAPGYMWVLSRAGPGPAAHVFEYDPSRSGRVAGRLLSGFRGTVVTDGFSGYTRLAQLGMTRAGCWAHVRRKFIEAAEIDGKNGKGTVATRALELIGRLYDVERKVAEKPADERHAARKAVSIPIVAELEHLADVESARVPPKSPTGKALAYLRGEWQALQVFLRDGRVPIDNNRVENSIRPFALGRKNWLFSATPAGARASANLYSLIETAKANGLDPHRYLKRVFTELPKAATADAVAALLPYPA
jgi:transposase